MSTSQENKVTFDKIYSQNRWLIGSGLGSVYSFNKPGVDFINRFIQEHPSIHTIVDIGCGDMQVGSKLAIDEKHYIGCDVSEVVLKKTREKHGQPNREFVLLDAVHDDLPDGDLAIVRDVILHLPNEDIKTLLHKLDAYKFVILQTNISDGPVPNENIHAGNFRLLDITAAPFSATQYTLAFTYTEWAFKIINPLLKLLGLQPHYKGIYVKQENE